jgi:hypothetical protein
MDHLCENCRRFTDLHYCRSFDAYLCEECADEAVPMLLPLDHRDGDDDY